MNAIHSPPSNGEVLNESGQLASRKELRFPHPTERPHAIVVIFDGRCRFCTGQVRWLQRFDFARCLSFISLHDPHVNRWWPALTYEMLMEQIYVLPPTSQQPENLSARTQWLGGIVGVRFIAWRLWLLWPLAVLLSIPGTLPLWQGLYRWIAQRRYRWGRLGPTCDPDGTCDLHFRAEDSSGSKSLSN
ncbi:MAG: DUF393 domain-containing protein [Planctomycetaceae bacterium]|nr:DUF393 domain-containing protein [Planctomycetaceae bacterium]